MSLFGYNKKTTPFLDSLKNNNHFISRLAIASGVYTDTAIPAIINTVKKPDGTPHILSQKTNLFKVAKDHNFQTTFISSQSKSSFDYTHSYLGVSYIDNYIDAGHKSSLDMSLAQKMSPFLKKEQNQFIVLNMSGSHEPYKTHYPKNTSVFGDKNRTQHYDNSVFYTDKVLEKILSSLDLNSKESTILFTSDHGQHVGKQGYGKGNLEIISDYTVPFFLYKTRQKITQPVQRFLNKSWLSHYEISKLTAYYLGYDTLAENDADKAFYVNGGELNGNSGYAKVTFDGTLLKYTIY